MRASLQTGSSRELGFSCLRRQFLAGHSSVTPVSAGPKAALQHPVLAGVWGPGGSLLVGSEAPAAIQWQLQLWLNLFPSRGLQPNPTSRLEAVA